MAASATTLMPNRTFLPDPQSLVSPKNVGNFFTSPLSSRWDVWLVKTMSWTTMWLSL